MSVCYSTDGQYLAKESPDECNMTYLQSMVLYNHKSVFHVVTFTISDRILGPSCVLACAQQQKVSGIFLWYISCIS